MFAVRDPLYDRFADYTIDNNGDPEETVHTILEVLK
jgi:shikimate kinase